MLSRHDGGVLGYYGLSGLGKSTVLDLFDQQIRQMNYTPYIVRLDFTDRRLHDVTSAFIDMVEQLEATGATRKRQGFMRRYSESPLNPALAALSPQLSIQQIIKIRASSGSVVQDIRNQVTLPTEGSKSQIIDAMGKFKIGITHLPYTPAIPPTFTGLKRRIVIVLADTFEQAPPEIIDWLRQLAGKMFNEYLLFIAAGQERIIGLLETALDRMDDKSLTQILTTRYGIFNQQTIRNIC